MKTVQLEPRARAYMDPVLSLSLSLSLSHTHTQGGNYNCIVDPDTWSRDHVRTWLTWAMKEYNLHDIDVTRFSHMDGKVGKKTLPRNAQNTSS